MKDLQIREIPKIAYLARNKIGQKLVYQVQGDIYTIYYDDKYEQKSVENISEPLKSKLYQFQKEGVQFGLQTKGRLLIGDEMGVGKTIQALAIAYLYREDWPLLIVCPSSLKLNWRDEILKWIPGVTSKEIQLIQKSSMELQISYDTGCRMIEQLQEKSFKCVIGDEAHYMKNQQSKRTEYLSPLFRDSRRVILLTGTPALNKPRELYQLLYILRPDIFNNFREFGGRYCNPTQTKWRNNNIISYDGSQNVKELHYILNNNIMIRRLKSDVLEQLPQKIRQKLQIHVEQKYIKQIQQQLNSINNVNQIIDNLLEQQQDNVYTQQQQQGHNNISINSVIRNSYILTGKSKVKGVIEYIQTLIESNTKFLLFAHHIEILNEIEQYMVDQQIQYIRIDGQVNINTRHQSVQQYQNNTNILVALLSLTAASLGLTLTAATTIVFAEMYWTPAIMAQAEDRAHRIGQTNQVHCIYIYAEGTLDSILFNKLQTKLQLLSNILDNGLSNTTTTIHSTYTHTPSNTTTSDPLLLCDTDQLYQESNSHNIQIYQEIQNSPCNEDQDQEEDNMELIDQILLNYTQTQNNVKLLDSDDDEQLLRSCDHILNQYYSQENNKRKINQVYNHDDINDILTEFQKPKQIKLNTQQ